MLCLLKKANREKDDNASEIRVAVDMLCLLKKANRNGDDTIREIRVALDLGLFKRAKT
jgi:hypothetical protein